MTRECAAFLGMCAVGAGAGLLFDIFRAVKRAANIKKAAAADALYWIIMTAAVWYAFLYLMDGSIRGFEIFGLLLGVFLYFMLLSSVVLKIFVNLFKFFFKILLTPARFLYKIIYRMSDKIKTMTSGFVRKVN